ncbi:MAG TPA: acyl-CoA dehydrogenase family protein [Pseudonocardia sp.]
MPDRGATATSTASGTESSTESGTESGTDQELLDDLASVARAALADRAGGDPSLDRARWRHYGELGWLGLLVPEQRGGAGADERAAGVVAREMGVAGRTEPFVAAGVMVPRCLAELPDTPAPRAMLDEVTGGTRLALLGWQSEAGELGTGLGPERLPVGAERTEDGVTLSGQVCWLPSLDADSYLIAADSPAGVVLTRVDSGTSGLLARPQPMADGSTWVRLELDRVRVPAEAVLAAGPVAERALSLAIDTGVLICAAELLGLIDRMLELTLGYLGSRRQFGRAIGSFQALQHRAVDLWMQQRLTEAAVRTGLSRAVGASPETLALAASGAKARASSAALRVGNESVQLHGAIGFTHEYELGRYVNRALVLAAWLGNARAHTRRYDRLAERAERTAGS